MSDRTGIQWTDATWNPTAGCSRVSPGCENCYAERQAPRLQRLPQYEGTVRSGPNGPRWTGRLNLAPADVLEKPLRWKRPRRIFVNSMSDLFHEKLSEREIAAVFGVMAACPQHTFQVLTKRADRMREWFAIDWDHATECGERAAAATGDSFASIAFGAGGIWPLPNVWLGVSVEDQQRADERIPHLLATPAAVRFVSYEPALGPVEFAQRGWLEGEENVTGDDPALDWIIVGGESGPKARPFDIRWARSVVQQCKTASVACFVKQLGSNSAWPLPLGFSGPLDSHGGDPAEWPTDLRVREFPR